MEPAINPAATDHLPAFVTGPGHTDVLMAGAVVLLIGGVLLGGNLYLRLHALPERMAHRTNHMQFEVVAVLALLALFTHNGLFWVAALLIAMVRVPDFVTPMQSMADSLRQIAQGGAGGSAQAQGGSQTGLPEAAVHAEGGDRA